ncbi:hypothetical protein HK101_008015 [Irineochytrium annulatum]|nr:hypothetical protein HK101_008015 [Irineochytrium annulatum]
MPATAPRPSLALFLAVTLLPYLANAQSLTDEMNLGITFSSTFVDANTVSITISAPGNVGWAAIGLGATLMDGAAIHVAGPNGQGGVTVGNYMGSKHDIAQADLGPVQVQGNTVLNGDGSWSATFTRSSNGVPVGNANFIWAAGVGGGGGNAAGPSYHGPAKGFFTNAVLLAPMAAAPPPPADQPPATQPAAPMEASTTSAVDTSLPGTATSVDTMQAPPVMDVPITTTDSEVVNVTASAATLTSTTADVQPVFAMVTGSALTGVGDMKSAATEGIRGLG